MERMKLNIEIFNKAMLTLKSIVEDEEFSMIVRDATIQRFEYTFEAFWKLIKIYLKENEGLICNSPKTCFRELFSIGIITKENTELLLEMTDDRNLTSHTYLEKIAQDIYSKIVDKYCCLIEDVANKIFKKFND